MRIYYIEKDPASFKTAAWFTRKPDKSQEDKVIEDMAGFFVNYPSTPEGRACHPDPYIKPGEKYYGKKKAAFGVWRSLASLRKGPDGQTVDDVTFIQRIKKLAQKVMERGVGVHLDYQSRRQVDDTTVPADFEIFFD